MGPRGRSPRASVRGVKVGDKVDDFELADRGARRAS